MLFKRPIDVIGTRFSGSGNRGKSFTNRMPGITDVANNAARTVLNSACGCSNDVKDLHCKTPTQLLLPLNTRTVGGGTASFKGV